MVITDREKLDKIQFSSICRHDQAGSARHPRVRGHHVGQLRQILGAGLLRRYGKPVARHAQSWLRSGAASPVPEREQAFRELFNLPDTVSPLGLAILGYSETPFSHKERYDEQKVHYNVW
ncbi:MAG: hypothetical protein ACLSAH_00655 [Bilophila wadsworthia]